MILRLWKIWHSSLQTTHRSNQSLLSPGHILHNVLDHSNCCAATVQCIHGLRQRKLHFGLLAIPLQCCVTNHFCTVFAYYWTSSNFLTFSYPFDVESAFRKITAINYQCIAACCVVSCFCMPQLIFLSISYSAVAFFEDMESIIDQMELLKHSPQQLTAKFNELILLHRDVLK